MIMARDVTIPEVPARVRVVVCRRYVMYGQTNMNVTRSLMTLLSVVDLFPTAEISQAPASREVAAYGSAGVEGSADCSRSMLYMRCG